MPAFLETTFGPTELEVIETALENWRLARSLPKDDPDVALAAAVAINLFREGQDTVPTLERALSDHKALADLAGMP